MDAGSFPVESRTGIWPARGVADDVWPFNLPAFFANFATGTTFAIPRPAAWPRGVEPSNATMRAAAESPSGNFSLIGVLLVGTARDLWAARARPAGMRRPQVVAPPQRGRAAVAKHDVERLTTSILGC